VFSTKIVDHGGHRGDAIQALAQWWHPLASSKAWDVLRWAMHPALYCCIRKVIKIARNFPTFFVIVDSIVANNLR
jgi:hypothetical protein